MGKTFKQVDYADPRIDKKVNKEKQKQQGKQAKQFMKNWSNTKATVGLHPSYNSSYNKYLLPFEVKLFNTLNIGFLNNSRQHFLRINPDTTFINLIKNGIYTDFSIGYSNALGFRAGTGKPFYYFDFENNTQTKLLHIPFALMDNALIPFIEKKEDAETLVHKLLSIAQLCNSPIMVVWHDWTLINFGPGKRIFPFYNMVKNIINW